MKKICGLNLLEMIVLCLLLLAASVAFGVCLVDINRLDTEIKTEYRVE